MTTISETTQRFPTSPRTGSTEGVIVVGAGPVGCAVALLLADRGVEVTLIERHLQPHPLPRAVHLDDEVLRILHGLGVIDDFLLASRPLSGLRLVDGSRRVLAEFPRELGPSENGFPYSNMFHQPDLEALLLARVEPHPRITLHRGLEVCRIDGVGGAPLETPVRVHARGVGDDRVHCFDGRFVLGCDGANSTVRDLLDIAMDDLNFTERWLVVDVRSDLPLDTWGGVEQVCDPARAGTFMRGFGDRYRWEFQLAAGEDEVALVRPDALGPLLRPWTGRTDLDGIEVVRSATYTFRARLAGRFQDGPVFILGDAAHLTPPFVGQGLGAGLRDADNLAWKLASVLAGDADPALLATYEAERRPHARALVRRAVRVGWAMTGGQDRAAAVRRAGLALAVRSARIRNAIASPATPPLQRGALQPRHAVDALRARSAPRVGRLMPNPRVRTADGSLCRLDDVIGGRIAVLTSRIPEEALVDASGQLGFTLVRLRPEGPAAPAATGDYVDVAVQPGDRALGALLDAPALAVLVRPDRVVAAVESRRPPTLPWAASTPGVALSNREQGVHR